jgi:hypothetical protein
MALALVWCPVLGARISRVTNFEGEATRINCPEYEDFTQTCRRKADALKGGPLAQLLERTSEETLASPGLRCDFGSG